MQELFYCLTTRVVASLEICSKLCVQIIIIYDVFFCRVYALKSPAVSRIHDGHRSVIKFLQQCCIIRRGLGAC